MISLLNLFQPFKKADETSLINTMVRVLLQWLCEWQCILFNVPTFYKHIAFEQNAHQGRHAIAVLFTGAISLPYHNHYDHKVILFTCVHTQNATNMFSVITAVNLVWKFNRCLNVMMPRRKNVKCIRDNRSGCLHVIVHVAFQPLLRTLSWNPITVKSVQSIRRSWACRFLFQYPIFKLAATWYKSLIEWPNNDTINDCKVDSFMSD